MKLLFNLLACTWLLSLGCSHTSQPIPETPSPLAAPAPAPRHFVESVRPTDKEILRGLLAGQDVSLSVDSSCSGVGTDLKDANIGDYVSGFLAEQTTAKGKNWLDVSAKVAAAVDGNPMWLCNVVIRHVDGDDRWGWGASYLMNARDHTVVKPSFRCTGSG